MHVNNVRITVCELRSFAGRSPDVDFLGVTLLTSIADDGRTIFKIIDKPNAKLRSNTLDFAHYIG